MTTAPETQDYTVGEGDDSERAGSHYVFTEGTHGTPRSQLPGRRGSTEPAKQLACSSCRKKKIRCQPSPGGGGAKCQGCVRSGTDCIVPFVDERKLSNSKRLVRELYEKIASLEAELDDLRTARAFAGNINMVDALAGPSTHTSPDMSKAALIRLCGGRMSPQVDDQCGQHIPRRPGTADDLLLTGVPRGLALAPEGTTWQSILPKPVEDKLLELYWRHQNDVIPIVYKSAFLQDYRSGRERYCSRLLLHCMLARAADIDAGSRDNAPRLLRICDGLLKEELREPTITTLQSLEILAGAHNGSASEREYLYLAVRLGSSFGMANSMSGTNSTETISSEREMKEICFLSCYLLDRQWTLYTGKPHLIDQRHTAGITTAWTPGASHERQLLMVWASLVEITELLVEAICGARSHQHRAAYLDHRLREWYGNLQPEYRYSQEGSPPPAVLHLYMHYSTTVILLHRPYARFGDEGDEVEDALQATSYRVCVQHACLVAQYVQRFAAVHGGLQNLVWVSLHAICTAAATLVAALAEGRQGTDSASLWPSLLTCIRALEELGEMHPPAEAHRIILLRIMRRLDLEAQANASMGDTQLLELPTESLWNGEVHAIVHPALNPAEDFLPHGGQGSLADMWSSVASLPH